MQPAKLSPTRRPFFWILQGVICLLGLLFAQHFYPKAFPFVDLEITMDRGKALHEAEQLATARHWLPEHARTSALFHLERATQNFIELECGGVETFSHLITQKAFFPYTWQVRRFQEKDPHETSVFFTPEGTLAGFYRKLTPSDPGAALPPAPARARAEAAYQELFGKPLTGYAFLESSQLTQISGRIDHTFTYQRPKVDFPGNALGDGTFRLRLTLSGEELTEVRAFVKIPEAFLLHYQELRSANELTASVSSLVLLLLYGLGGCGFGLFYLIRQRRLVARPALLLAAGIALLGFVEALNQLPLAWMDYDTALSSSQFLARKISNGLIQSLFDFFILSVTFITAEGLTRAAFPQHPQFWQLWRAPQSGSLKLLGLTLGGYLTLGLALAYLVSVYLVGKQLLGWWSPSETFFEPNALATFFPPLTALSRSLHAAVWEEALFRALPLAGACLLGQRLGRPRLLVAVSFLLQALVFASAHANYPTQPFYARVVELIVPSWLFAGLFLRFGLLPGILLHFSYDTLLFALPLWTLSTPNIFWDRFFVVFFALTPLWVVLVARFQQGAFLPFPASALNQAWLPPAHPPDGQSLQSTTPPLPPQPHPPRTLAAFSLLALAALLLTLSWLKDHNQTLLLTLSRQEAITLARKTLLDQHLPGGGNDPTTVLTPIQSHDSAWMHFLWRQEPRPLFHALLGNFLPTPSWNIRFLRLDLPLKLRSDEYQVHLSQAGQVAGVFHLLPETAAGASLSEAAAKEMAQEAAKHWAMAKHLNLQASDDDSANKNNNLWQNEWKLEGKECTERQARRDWEFVFSNPAIRLQTPEAQARVRIVIAGDTVSSVRPSYFLPESYLRTERAREAQLALASRLSKLALLCLQALLTALAAYAWTQRRFSACAFYQTALGFFLLEQVLWCNGLPARLAEFSIAEPWSHQLFLLIAFRTTRALFLALWAGLHAGWVFQRASAALASPPPPPAAATPPLQSRVGWQQALFCAPGQAALAALALGMISEATLSVVRTQLSHLLPATLPIWDTPRYLNTLFPALEVLAPLRQLLLMSCGLASLNQLFEWLQARKTSPLALAAFLLLLGACLAGTSLESPEQGLVLAATWVSLVGVTLKVAIRGQAQCIPAWVTGFLVLSELQHLPHGASAGLEALTLSLLLASGGALSCKLMPTAATKRESKT